MDEKITVVVDEVLMDMTEEDLDEILGEEEDAEMYSFDDVDLLLSDMD